MTKENSEGITQLKKRIKELEEQLEVKNKLIFSMENSVPTEQTARKKYVADVAFFYGTIFKKQIQHMIGLQLEELAQIGRTELGNNIIRSNINCFRIIDEWMEEKTNEHFGNLEQIRESFVDDKDFISKIKETYDN